jgi:L-asparaginase
MAFTASALSFMLQNLAKPVILTGSQLPIGTIRTDGKENLITAIEIAAAQKNNKPIVTEVCVYFEYKLHRGNRTLKYNSAHFDAFKSPNYPALAEAGVTIDYKTNYLLKPSKKQFAIQTHLDNDVVVLKLFPGLSKKITLAILNIPEIKGVIIETFGAGNASTQSWFIDALKTAINKGIIVYNVTQCPEGKVVQGMYETSSHLKKIGVISGQDITIESAITKLMFVLGQKLSLEKTKKQLETNLVGEISE